MNTQAQSAADISRDPGGDGALERMRDLLARAGKLANSEPLRGHALAEEALAIARECGRASDEAYALLTRARCALPLSEYAKVLEDAHAALAIFEQLNDLHGQAHCTTMLGNVQVHLSDFPEGIYLYERALELALAADDRVLITMIRGNMTMVEADMGNWPQALEIAAANRADNAGSEPEVVGGVLRFEAHAHLEAGLVLNAQDRREEAAVHLHRAVALAGQALEIFTRTGTVRFQRSSMVIAAEAYNALGDNDNAARTARAILEAKGQEMPRAAVAAQMVLGAAAKNAGDHATAAGLLLTALKMSELEAGGILTGRICHLLSEVYETLGDAALALQYSRRAATVQQVLRDEAMQRRARLLEDRRRREIAERQAARLSRELSDKEAQLDHANRLAGAGELLSVITHELAQPLSAIMSYAEAGLFHLDDESLDRRRLTDAVTGARAETLRASEVIDRLRQLMSRKPPDLVPIDLGRAVRDTLKILREGVRSHHVQVVTQLDGQLPKASADEILLVQILINLVRNAIEAMESIDERERKLEIVARRSAASGIVVEVADNGPGFAAGVGERVFDPFFSTKESGMGLGLAVCRTIATSFGGHLTAANRQPRGAVFMLTLNAAP